MQKEDTLSKSKVFNILAKEPERVRLEPKILYEGGELDPMKNRIYVEVSGVFVQTSFHLCESCPKTSINRLIKVKNAVRHSLVSHARVHEKSKTPKNPITKHFSSKIQIPTERLTKYHKQVALALARGNLPISFFASDSSESLFRAIKGKSSIFMIYKIYHMC